MLYSFVRKVRNKIKILKNHWERYEYSKYKKKFGLDMVFSQAAKRFQTRNELHAYTHHHFYHLSPPQIREHRLYFSKDSRGFGEDAFHAMWWMLFGEYSPEKCLEIGVYRGQVISLWALIAKLQGAKVDIHAISPFQPEGDLVSKYRTDIDYLADTQEAFSFFNLKTPTLIKAFSTDPLSINHIKRYEWDLIYIDGSHDYEVVLSDYTICLANLRNGGILVLDDSSAFTDFIPPSFSFAGHPGPSKVAKDFAMREMKFIGAVGHNSIFRKHVL